jgi:hypothetical protein
VFDLYDDKLVYYSTDPKKSTELIIDSTIQNVARIVDNTDDCFEVYTITSSGASSSSSSGGSKKHRLKVYSDQTMNSMRNEV